MKKILVSTDGEGDQLATDNARYIKFAKDMTKAGIPWRTYSGRGMYGERCPAAVTGDGTSEQTIIRATTVERLKTDSLGLHLIIYP